MLTSLFRPYLVGDVESVVAQKCIVPPTHKKSMGSAPAKEPVGVLLSLPADNLVSRKSAICTTTVVDNARCNGHEVFIRRVILDFVPESFKLYKLWNNFNMRVRVPPRSKQRLDSVKRGSVLLLLRILHV